MESEWLDVVAVNDKYIVHGQILEYKNTHNNAVMTPKEKTIEQVLTQEQKREVDDLLTEHSREFKALLKSFVND